MTPPALTAPPPPRHARPEDFHPLEVIPFFSRWPSGPLRDVLYTLVWNCLLGGIFWVIAGMFRPELLNRGSLYASLLFANAIGYTLHAMFLVASAVGLDAWARRRGGLTAAAFYTLVCAVGVVGGSALVMAPLGKGFGWLLMPQWISSMALSSALISTIIGVIFFARERQATAEARLAGERARAERIEREAALANLRALQGQIEPHFLFNTLANVASLVDADPAKAKRMLESFNRFLRSSLAATRTASTTLAAEAQLIAAYLEVLQVRMGARLRYRVDLPRELEDCALPPMLLQPIVENAIEHGLEPKVEGGEVAVTAARRGDTVVVMVTDTGVGFAPTTRGGLGLANVRDRLRLLYGDRGGLAIAENPGGGTAVTVTLPL